ncbi:hypothetical protein HX860_05740 [Marine Group I thaumarchaeote]|uniref:Uncharacterized protein n=1 Tax=Marine Group I thaumarchaeote TaxID=2511932 RepID=A0A7K4MHJ0_9ARCH|nr:MAG: hypothetical protein DSN69_04230 [Nitrosopumilus sp. YT1]NMI82421.1 hypothetical protein [Candidatus Nitrosopumilus sp. MTA1]NWJ20550.1 hypothetical protein [Marine Group I thaumarchaeote]NWJ28644.1 hypothetical protein [Marine Group I thaumarchaeote]NWJ56543.1 hypothetical protein [Marine Group I thaumarchaeote]
MKYLLAIVLLAGFFFTPAFAQDVNNLSVIIDLIEIPAEEFNTVLRDAPIIPLDDVHGISWQVTIDNNLLYANPNGDAVLRIYNQDLSGTKFIEVGMGSQPDNKLWVAVKTPKEGYIIVHRDLDRGWYPEAKLIISYTDRAGLTVNNGGRIVVTNLDIDLFAIDSYSVHGMEGSTDPPAVNSGSMIVEFLSGDPAKNIFALYPFFLAIGLFAIVGVLIFTKKRS